ncbi:transposase, partial [Nocardiopsis sp. CNT312]|uniref:transposase n=1 Tax=Nocardiopsis sp. CNT312 TaxID=1137268 RepID=UPI0018CC3F25
MTRQKARAAAALMIEAQRAEDDLNAFMAAIRGCFARTQPWLTATGYVRALLSDLPKRNGWTIAEWIGHRTPDRVQRLLNQAVWDSGRVMRALHAYAVAGLDAAAGARAMAIGALDETGQEKKGRATAGVKRQHMGCAGGVANGINTVHLSYVRQGVGHALIGCRQWIPAEQVEDEATATRMGLPEGLGSATKGQLATIIGSGTKTLVQVMVDPTTEREAPEGEESEAGGEHAGVPGPVAVGDTVIATD